MRIRTCCTYLALALVASLPAIGCNQRNVPNPKGPVAPAPPLAVQGPPLTEEDYRVFGKQLEAAVNAGDKATVDRLYRVEELAERAVSNLEMSPAFRKGVLTGIKNAQSSQFSQQLINVVQKGGKFTFLRVRMENGSPRVVIRLIINGGGLNYQELTLARHADGTIVAEDVHVLLSGEKISQTMRRMILNVAAENDRGLMAKLQGSEKLYSDNLGKIQAITQAVKQGRNQDAFNTYNQLPAELQKDKTLHMMAIVAAQEVNNDDYLRVLKSFRANHPNDPGIDLISIDYFLLTKQYTDCLGCIDRLGKAIGGDAYLLALSGNVMLQAGRHADAKAATEKAVELEPKLDEGYWGRISIALKEKNHPETLDWLRKVVTQCNMPLDMEEIRTNADYAAFAKSEQYQTLKKWYQARQK